MKKRGFTILKLLINRYAPAEREALLQFLPREEAYSVTSCDIESSDLTPLFEQPKRSLASIHYSWIQPAIEKFPIELQKAVISCLLPEQISGLKVSSPLHLSAFSKSFFIEQLYEKLEIGNHLPPEYLPGTELSPLLHWSKGELIEIIDFLGLHDLASEVRQIVNRNHLKNIYSCLNSKQLYYLKACLQQKELIVSPKLGIDPTAQDCVKLKLIVHRRGLSRLGKALCGQHPDMVWHLSHSFDMGRGNILLKDFRPIELPRITNVLRQQVVSLMNFLKTPQT